MSIAMVQVIFDNVLEGAGDRRKPCKPMRDYNRLRTIHTSVSPRKVWSTLEVITLNHSHSEFPSKVSSAIFILLKITWK